MRKTLRAIIRSLGKHPERYARRPDRDFIRRRALPIETLIFLLLTMSKKSTEKELMGHHKTDTPSVSALIQQRQKLLPVALEELFYRFTAFLRPSKTFRGFRLLTDRNYESYNNLVHLEKRGRKYVIPLRDQGRASVSEVRLPEQPEFDLSIRLTLGRLTPRQLTQRGIPIP